MTVFQGEVDSIALEAEGLVNTSGTQEFGTALVRFEMPAFTGSDTGKLGGAGGKDRGVATSDTLATIIQKQRRDGKTVTIKSAMLAHPGVQAGVRFYTGALVVSAGNLTFTVTIQDESTAATAAAGVRDQPLGVWVRYALS